MKNVVTNAFIFTDRSGIMRLFAEVVEDERYETGHHIVTSQVVSHDEKTVITESGTVYEVEKFLTKDEFVSHIKESYDEERINYYLFYTNLI